MSSFYGNYISCSDLERRIIPRLNEADFSSFQRWMGRLKAGGLISLFSEQITKMLCFRSSTESQSGEKLMVTARILFLQIPSHDVNCKQWRNLKQAKQQIASGRDSLQVLLRRSFGRGCSYFCSFKVESHIMQVCSFFFPFNMQQRLQIICGDGSMCIHCHGGPERVFSEKDPPWGEVRQLQ